MAVSVVGSGWAVGVAVGCCSTSAVGCTVGVGGSAVGEGVNVGGAKVGVAVAAVVAVAGDVGWGASVAVLHPVTISKANMLKTSKIDRFIRRILNELRVVCHSKIKCNLTDYLQLDPNCK